MEIRLQKTMIVQAHSRCRWIRIPILLGLLFFSPSATQALDEQAEEDSLFETTTELPSWLQTPDGYVYSSASKPDPFRPFIRPAPPEEIFRPHALQRPLTPLELVEAAQLRVVGIVRHGQHQEDALAMVEMPDGKGYILRSGVAVGRHGGVVHRISAHEVVILEQGLDITGREQSREVILKLHPSQGVAHE